MQFAIDRPKLKNWPLSSVSLVALLFMGCGGGGSVSSGDSDVNFSTNSVDDASDSSDDVNLPPVIGSLPTTVSDDEAIIGRLNVTDEDTDTLSVEVASFEEYEVTIDEQNVVRIADTTLSSSGDIIIFTVSATDDAGETTQRVFNVEVEQTNNSAGSFAPTAVETTPQVVTVELNLENITTFNSIQFDIVFDEDVLDYLEGSLSSEIISSLIVNDTASQDGIIRVAGISLDPMSGTAGDIVSVDFNQLLETATDIQFLNIIVDDVQLSAESVNVIA